MSICIMYHVYVLALNKMISGHAHTRTCTSTCTCTSAVYRGATRKIQLAYANRHMALRLYLDAKINHSITHDV